MIAIIGNEGSGLQKYNERYVVRWKKEKVRKEEIVLLCRPLEAELRLTDDRPTVIPGMRMLESGHTRSRGSLDETTEIAGSSWQVARTSTR